LFILAQCNHKSMPTPSAMVTSKASEHDLNIAKKILKNTQNIRIFCDMAFIDEE